MILNTIGQTGEFNVQILLRNYTSFSVTQLSKIVGRQPISMNTEFWSFVKTVPVAVFQIREDFEEDLPSSSYLLFCFIQLFLVRTDSQHVHVLSQEVVHRRK